MAPLVAPLYALNRGEVSRLALGRVDVERMRLSAEEQRNWLPLVLGPMMLRPGLGMVGGTKGDKVAKIVPFVFDAEAGDTALLEMTDVLMRVWIHDGLLMRPAVSTVVTHGDFSSSVGWTLTASGGGATTIAAGQLNLTGGSVNGSAKAAQTIAVAAPDRGVEHALRIQDITGPVYLRLGSTSGDDDLIQEAVLQDGMHSLAFTPTTANVYLTLEGRDVPLRAVQSIQIEAAGALELPTPWAQSKLRLLRWQQSADVIFVAAKGLQQYRIERRGDGASFGHSWSIVKYKPDDGPFQAGDSHISLTPSALSGNITLSASRPFFKSSNVGSLFRLFHSGQNTDDLLSASDTYGGTIRVTGVDTQGTDSSHSSSGQRTFQINITGVWAGTLTLQKSTTDAVSGFADVANYTANTATSKIDTADNQIVWWRIGFKPAAWTSGTAEVELSYPNGGGSGVCRVTGYSSSTAVSAEVLSPSTNLIAFRNTTSTNIWYEELWSNRRGWPTAVVLYEGRLWWLGNDRWVGSISDDYASFDFDKVGDAGPIIRSIGAGPIANIHWGLALDRLLAGTDVSLVTAKSSSFDEPLTPTNFNLKDTITQGAASLPAIKVDLRGVFVNQSGRRVYEAAITYQSGGFSYTIRDLTRLNPDIGMPGFVSVEMQSQPDRRIHFTRTDGVSAILLYDVNDEVEAWWRLETSGAVEDSAMLPSTLEDAVYYVVARTVNGATKRFIERHARIDECQGHAINKQADCHVVYSGAPTNVLSVPHLVGADVIVWADGRDLSPDDANGVQKVYRVSAGGLVTLDPGVLVSNAVTGLGYDAWFKSSKLAYGAKMGTAINQPKRVDSIGVQFDRTHHKGLQYGSDYAHLDDLPAVEDGIETPTDTIWNTYDQQMFPLNGEWNTDSRVCLHARAPRPVTVLGVVVGMDTNG